MHCIRSWYRRMSWERKPRDFVLVGPNGESQTLAELYDKTTKSLDRAKLERAFADGWKIERASKALARHIFESDEEDYE